MFFESALHHVVHQMRENLLHLLHVRNASRHHRVLKVQELLFADGLVTDVPLLLVHADQCSFAFRFSEHHRNQIFRSVIRGETGFEMAGADVNDDGFVFFVHLNNLNQNKSNGLLCTF